MTENRELVHKYLGITVDYSIVSKVIFTMFDYLKDMIVECTEDLKISRSYYSRNNQLFKLVKDSLRISQEDVELFHCHVEGLLFASKRVRPNIQLCAAVLCT